MHRRQVLSAGLAASAMAWPLQGVLAQSASAPARPLPLLRIYIPGGAGGGWDQTGRALGAAIQAAGLAGKVEYENKGGKGGTVGLADFVARFGQDPGALLIGGMVMLGAIAVGRPEVTLAQVSPIARLTNDFMVLVSKTGAGPQTMAALVDALRKDLGSVVFTGGSAGGVDHMLAGMLARQLRLDVTRLRYTPTTSGREAVALLDKGEALIAISSYSEFQADIEKKTLTALAVSSRKGLYGVRSLAEQGVNTELGNWRAVFGPGQISDAERENLRRIVVTATQHPSWAQALQDKKWIAALMHGKDFADALTVEQAIASAVTMMLRLKG